MADRAAAVGDLWGELRTRKRSLRQPMARLQQLVASA
jgi:hypothetical protein